MSINWIDFDVISVHERRWFGFMVVFPHEKSAKIQQPLHKIFAQFLLKFVRKKVCPSGYRNWVRQDEDESDATHLEFSKLNIFVTVRPIGLEIYLAGWQERLDLFSLRSFGRRREFSIQNFLGPFSHSRSRDTYWSMLWTWEMGCVEKSDIFANNSIIKIFIGDLWASWIFKNESVGLLRSLLFSQLKINNPRISLVPITRSDRRRRQQNSGLQH